MLTFAAMHDNAVTTTEAELRKEMETLEEEAFALLETILDDEEEPSVFDDLFERDQRETEILEDESFALLKSFLQGEDAPTMFDDLFVRDAADSDHKDTPNSIITDQREMKKPEDETFAFLESILTTKDESSVYEELFIRDVTALEHDEQPYLQQYHDQQTENECDQKAQKQMVDLKPSTHNVRETNEVSIFGEMLQRLRVIIM